MARRNLPTVSVAQKNSTVHSVLRNGRMRLFESLIHRSRIVLILALRNKE